ncbi:MAG: metallophosphoesterase family protein [Candidatus Jordarchaeum sp.]|uniref:metallophosphoesterase family protein n=1 Tax=Candidatus Jordarchaeum sp. TaxID=2823881 RepID=UPI00404A9312
MRFVVLGDIHSNVEAAEKARKYIKEKNPDAVLVCGDITHSGGKSEAQKLIETLASDKIPVFYVFGNMDRVNPDFQVEGINAKCLHGKKTEFKGVDIIGLSCTWEYDFLSDIEKSEKPLIIVSHEPPKDCLDKTWNGSHAGNIQIRNFIEKIQPELMFCGHIHEAHGEAKIGKTIVCNVGKLGSGNIITIDINDEIGVTRDRI